MKGIVLAGGTGSRLLPMTSVTNKHLLPVYNKPMIYYPIQHLVNSGITDIMVVTGGEFAGDFLNLLKNGEDFNLTNLQYAYQKGSGGIADALSLAEDFVGGDKICVILGDNIFEFAMPDVVNMIEKTSGASIVLKEVDDPERFGVANLDENGKVTSIVEKPKDPQSNLAVTGIYFYDEKVFDIIRTLEPSGRGELEITDVNNDYLKEGTLNQMQSIGWWSDAGTPDSLLRASCLVKEKGAGKV